MTERRPAVTIMVHRDGSLESRRVRIPLWAVRLLTILGSAVGVLLLLGAILYAPIVRTAARVPSLERAVARLEAENAKVTELARALDEMEEHYRQVRTMLGADVVPEPPRSTETPPIARPVMAVAPGAPLRYAIGPSLPRHWPLDEPGFVTRGLVAAGGSQAEEHQGIDVAVPTGTPIRAAGGGVVIEAGEDPELGLFIRLAHPDSYESIYGHASRLLVSAGDSLSAGQVIGLSGSTGRSTAPHLHFEIRRSGRLVDPRTLLDEGR